MLSCVPLVSSSKLWPYDTFWLIVAFGCINIVHIAWIYKFQIHIQFQWLIVVFFPIVRYILSLIHWIQSCYLMIYLHMNTHPNIVMIAIARLALRLHVSLLKLDFFGGVLLCWDWLKIVVEVRMVDSRRAIDNDVAW